MGTKNILWDNINANNQVPLHWLELTTEEAGVSTPRQMVPFVNFGWCVRASSFLFSVHFQLFLSIPFSSSESVLEDCLRQAHQTASGAHVSCQTFKQSFQCRVRHSCTLSLFTANGTWLARTTLLSIPLHCYYLPRAIHGICMMHSAWSESRKVDCKQNMSLCSPELWHSLDSWLALMEKVWYPKTCMPVARPGGCWGNVAFTFELQVGPVHCSFLLFLARTEKHMPIRKWNTGANYSQGPVKEAKPINRLHVPSMQNLL